MGARFEELAWRSTPMGELSLRRRIDPALNVEVFEVKLGAEYLMSSLFTVAEIELARLALAACPLESGIDIVVGGLGLGYTAHAALADDRVGSLIVLDAHDDVIGWHRDGLLPLSNAIATDPRCRLVHRDFFAAAAGNAGTGGDGFDPQTPGRTFDVIAVDIDHSPRHLLDPGHAGFYTADGLRRLAARLRPGGVFALWSDDPPDTGFTAVVEEVFGHCAAHVVTFANPIRGGESANTVYVAT